MKETLKKTREEFNKAPIRHYSTTEEPANGVLWASSEDMLKWHQEQQKTLYEELKNWAEGRIDDSPNETQVYAGRNGQILSNINEKKEGRNNTLQDLIKYIDNQLKEI